MDYFDWTELVTEVLGIKPFDEDDRYRVKVVKDNIVILFGYKEPTRSVLKTRKAVRAWVQKFYDDFGYRHYHATIYKGLIEIEDDNSYGQWLSILLEYLWD